MIAILSIGRHRFTRCVCVFVYLCAPSIVAHSMQLDPQTINRQTKSQFFFGLVLLNIHRTKDSKPSISTNDRMTETQFEELVLLPATKLNTGDHECEADEIIENGSRRGRDYLYI